VVGQASIMLESMSNSSVEKTLLPTPDLLLLSLLLVPCSLRIEAGC